MALRQFARQSARSLGLRSDVSAFAPAVATRGMSTVIEGLKYMASHEWAKVDGDTVTVGITDHAQAELGDVVYVELPEVGSTVEAKSTFGVVESVKAASDVYSPISGEVVAVNEELADSPGAVNEGAFTDGWMMKVKMSNPADLDALMDAKAYEASCDNGFDSRLIRGGLHPIHGRARSGGGEDPSSSPRLDRQVLKAVLISNLRRGGGRSLIRIPPLDPIRYVDVISPTIDPDPLSAARRSARAPPLRAGASGT